MQPHDMAAFSTLLSGVMAYHRQPMSDALLQVWWNGCQEWDLDQVTKAINQLTKDPEAGKFPPKIGDITRMLDGTHGDRAAMAWGKCLDTMRRVGAYQDVVFDDPAIHVAVEDAGGWPKLCRTPLDELGYVQTRFCAAHRAYTGRAGAFDFPRRLIGDRSPDYDYERRGLPLPDPVLIGDPKRCARVLAKGSATGRTQITSAGKQAMELMARLTA